MKLQGRNLSIRMQGQDVTLLHTELRAIGFSIDDGEMRGGTFGPRTQDAVRRFQVAHALPASGVVDELTAAAINRELDQRRADSLDGHVVRGHIRDANGRPFTAGFIRVFDKDLRSEELLGETAPDTAGYYEVRYTPEQFQRTEKQSADVIVRISNRDRTELFATAVIFNVAAVQTIDIVLDQQPRLSEFERYVAEIRPLLGALPFGELKDADLDFIVGETGIARLHVAWLAVAHEYEATTRIEAAVFYGLFRGDLPSSLPALLLQASTVLRGALESAIEQNIIPRLSAADLERVMAALRRLVGERVLGTPGDEAVPRLLTAAGLSPTEQDSFLSAYLEHASDIESFWESLRTTPLAGKVPRLQGSLQLGLVTLNNLPLVAALQNTNVHSARDVARLERQELERLIASSPEILAGIPSSDPAETAAQKAARKAEGILEVLNAAMPTAFIQASYGRSADPMLREVGRVLDVVPQLELRDDHIDEFLEKNPTALAGATDPDAVRTQLKRVQRAIRVAPHARHAEELLSAGLDSAQSIVSLSPAAFEEMFADKLGGATQALAYYQKAQQVSASVFTIAAAVSQSLQAAGPSVIEVIPDSVKTLPNFTALFGSQSLCACEHCSSVLSPAAYLVDLLELLNPKAGPKPLAKLRQKRPDIEHILLTCENTHTPLPYVDLVNEVLEYYVAHGSLAAAAARNTQGMTAEELSVSPQFVIDEAYQTLAGAVYPPSLPLQRPVLRTRAHLEQLGTTRHELMRIFRRGVQPGETDIELEYLKISATERDLLTGGSGRPLADFYGYPIAQDPGALTQITVAEFLRRAVVSFEELTALLASRFLNADGAITLESTENPPGCDLTKLLLKNLTAAFWQKAHRFIRLQRKLGWSLQELDLAAVTFQAADITVELMRKLAAAHRLAADLRLPLNVLFSFWSDLDTSGPSSLYSRLFLNKALANPPDQAFVPGTPENSAALLQDHAPQVLAALRLGESDFLALTTHLGLDAGATLSVANLSALHRHAALARALRLEMAEWLALVALTGTEPFVAADPLPTRQLVEVARSIRESEFGIDTLSYVFRHVAVGANPPAPSPASVLVRLRELQAGLKKIAAAQGAQFEQADPLRSSLSLVLPDALVQPALDAIYGTPLLTNAQREAFIDAHLAQFFDAADAKAQLLDPAATAQTQQAYVVTGLEVYQRRQLIVQSMSDFLGLPHALVDLLLGKVLRATLDPAKAALHDFASLADLPEDIPDATMSNIGRTVTRSHKASLLLRGFDIGAPLLAHLAEHGADFDDFDLNTLPVIEAEFQPALFQQWQRLARLQPLAHLVGVFAAATAPAANPRAAAIEQLKMATGWSAAETDFLVGPGGFDLATADDFRNETKLIPLRDCMRLGQQLGIACERLFSWADTEPDAVLAQVIVETVKARYTDEQWINVATPINDRLRESQRQALVSYVLAHDTKVKQSGITSANQLFEYFLIDVEMCAGMDTSRIKQAASSVQLFIQRCLMNLEDGVSPSAIDADRWQWMKNYRVWEANRKVFLYPENWIEPELRDDKSSFFRQLETELLQNELSPSTAESAFVHYLEKLDQVSRLDICGLYVQKPQTWGDEEVVHVFGRTRTTPRVYFYRRLLNGQTWTPWDKIDMDIEGDHLAPVVHNRRLYLFWLHFEEKQDEVQQLPHAYIQSQEHHRWITVEHPEWKSAHAAWVKEHDFRDLWKALEALYRSAAVDATALQELKVAFGDENGFDLTVDEAPEPREPEEPDFSAPPALRHWDVHLAWTEYKAGQWSAKEMSPTSVTSPHVATSLQGLFLSEGGILGGSLALGLLNKAFQLIPPALDGSWPETIFSVYLPARSEHYLRTSVDAASGDLRVQLLRRYHTEAPVLNVPTLTIEGHESVGWFALRCGNKVSATSGLESRDFDALPRPRQTDNLAMSFQHRPNVSKTLTFNAGGDVRHILSDLPGTGDFGLLHQHQRAEFRLKPPYHDFFFQDQYRTYFASWQGETPLRLVSTPGLAQLSVAPASPAALVSSSHNLLTSSAGKRTKQVKGNHVQVFQSSSQAQSMAMSGTALVMSQGISSKSAGLFLQSSVANQVVDLAETGGLGQLVNLKDGLRFETFFHPHACQFIERLYRHGIPELLSRKTQQLDNDSESQGNVFKALYAPTSQVTGPYPREHVDFDYGAYASYNWELFFHIPMLIAQSLTNNQRFEDALAWYHFVFDPTTNETGGGRKRFWNTLPFYENAHPEKEQIQTMLLALAGKKSGWKQIEAQIEASIADPFNPHLIARLRLTAYQKNVVMKYIDNLIAWADQLFSRDTLESINEATLLYVLACNILGPRPRTIAARTKLQPKTYQQLAGELDAFGNALVSAENIVPYKSQVSSPSMSSQALSPQSLSKKAAGAALGKSALQSLYFCVPHNAEMLSYWDKVDDRLFKIRNSLSIDGVRRTLPLFEPPIDPALLVKARAAGVDLGTVLNDLFAPLPHYRFSTLLQKSLDLCNELKSMGGALLAALEKRDAEALANLRASHETTLLKAITEVRRQQVDEAGANIEALQKTRVVTEARYAFYRDIERISTFEQNNMDSLALAHSFNLVSQSLQATASAAFYVPDITTGTSGACASPVTTVTFGGSTIGPAIQSGATIASMVSGAFAHDANMASIMGSQERRWDEWKLQEKLASKELTHLDQQIAAAEIRRSIAAKELENHELQVTNSVAVEDFLRGKYTSADLYGWMITQVSKVYFQAYKLATDLAKRAERSYRHELGVASSNFIQFGYWDTLRKGLLAGEQLTLDLKRLDTAYLNQNRREYELTRHVSLLQVSPLSLLELRATGRCILALPEELFDMDGPGHYFRRIKSVALTIPCVAGPYSSVNCTLTLLKSTVRTDSLLSGGGYARQGDEDIRFVDSLGAVQAMVTSTAQSDSGLFEANLRDERYLPFEYSGVMSEWQLELPANPANGDPAQFDYDTISDVILTLRYTAREGGTLLRQGALDNLKDGIQSASVAGTTRLFSVRHEFPTEWARFQGQVPGEDQRFELSLNLRAEHYPFWSQGRLETVARVDVLLRSTAEPAPASVTLFGVADQGAPSQPQDTLAHSPTLGNVLSGQFSAGPGGLALPETPVTALTLCFDERAMSDLWIAITWGGGATG